MPNSLSVALASGVRMVRAEKRITQEQLADLMHLSRASVADVESGRRRVAVDDLEPLCCALGVTLGELLRLTERGREAAGKLGIERP